MRDLVRADQRTCIRCKWHTGMRQNGNVLCNYISRTGHSRIFEDGEMAYAPEFCDKFKPMKRKREKEDIEE